jgi:hypothetical protein
MVSTPACFSAVSLQKRFEAQMREPAECAYSAPQHRFTRAVGVEQRAGVLRHTHKATRFQFLGGGTFCPCWQPPRRA